MLKLLGKKTVLYVWTVMFFIVLIITIVTNGIILTQVKSNLSAETENKNSYAVKCIQKSCDSMLTDTKHYSEMLSENSSLIKLTEMPLSSEARFEASVLSQYMLDSSAGSIYLNETYVYFPLSGIVVNSTGARESESFFNTYLTDEFESCESWISKIKNYQQNYSDYTDKKINFYTNTEKYVICVSVDKKAVLDEVFMAESDDIILVVNSRGKIIYKWGTLSKEENAVEILNGISEESKIKIGKTRMIGITEKSRVSRYKYIYLSPLSIQNRIISDTLIMGFTCSFICVILMIVLFALLILWNYRQISFLIKNSGSDLSDDTGKNEFNIINNRISNFKKQIRNFEQKSRKDDDLRREIVIADILRGFKVTDDKMKSKFDENHIYGVVIILIDDCGIISDGGKRTETCEEEARFIVKNVMSDLLGTYKIEWTVIDGKLTGIFISETPVYENYKTILEDIMKKASEALGTHLEMQLSFYVSEPVKGTKSFPELHEQAEKALEFGKFYGLSDVFYEDITEADRKFPVISHNLENALVTAIKSGNKQDAASVMNKILNDYLISKPVSKWYVNSLVAILMHIIKGATLRGDFEVSENWENTRKFSDVRMVAKCMNYILDSAMQKEGNNSENDITEQIVKYIDENFTDCDLCVNSIGDRFDMSAQYISRLFRKKYGFRIVDYIHKLRINYAKQILETDSQAKIENIAETVGYGTSRAFMMRFKESEGITPTQYKSNIKK